MYQGLPYMEDNLSLRPLYGYRPVEEEKTYPTSFSVRRIFQIKGLSVEQTQRRIAKYEDTDDLFKVNKTLNPEMRHLLSFIGQFKSVQYLHILREVYGHPEVYGNNNGKSKALAKTSPNEIVTKTKWTEMLKRLYLNGLVQQFSHQRIFADGEKKEIIFYTLSDAGYKFLDAVEGNRVIHQIMAPNNFYKIPEIAHLQYWMALDIYQAINGTKPFKAFHTFFSGLGYGKKTKGVVSPLQIRMALEDEEERNYVFYPYLVTQQTNDAKNIVFDYAQLVNDEELTDRVFIPELEEPVQVHDPQYHIRPVFIVQNTQSVANLASVFTDIDYKVIKEHEDVNVLVLVMSLVKSKKEQAGLPNAFFKIYPFNESKIKEGTHIKLCKMESF